MSIRSDIQTLIKSDSQERIIVLQVFRNGVWQTLQPDSFTADIAQSKAGSVTIQISPVRDDDIFQP